jgi:hypothetical protein
MISKEIASFETPSPKTKLKMVGYDFWLIKVKGAIVSVAIRVADRHIIVVIVHLLEMSILAIDAFVSCHQGIKQIE